MQLEGEIWKASLLHQDFTQVPGSSACPVTFVTWAQTQGASLQRKSWVSRLKVFIPGWKAEDRELHLVQSVPPPGRDSSGSCSAVPASVLGSIREGKEAFRYSWNTFKPPWSPLRTTSRTHATSRKPYPRVICSYTLGFFPFLDTLPIQNKYFCARSRG